MSVFKVGEGGGNANKVDVSEDRMRRNEDLNNYDSKNLKEKRGTEREKERKKRDQYLS